MAITQPDPASGVLDRLGIAILEADTCTGVAQALSAALRNLGLPPLVVAYTSGAIICRVPSDAVPTLRDDPLTELIAAHAGGLPLPPWLLVLCNGSIDATAVVTTADGSALPDFSAGQQRLLTLAGRRMAELFASLRVQASMIDLAKAEQLQRALFAIADMAGSNHDMPTLLRGLHAIIGTLMYAENFYIAQYDKTRDSLRFLYFADTVDEHAPQPHEDVPLARLERGLTWYLVHERKPLMGSHDEIRGQISGPLQPRGAGCLDWLGVPMLRNGEVVGALVVQTYSDGIRYTDADRAVLAFVAEHVLNAVERKQGQEQLELRVTERTVQLAQANADLERQLVARARAEHLQATLYRIAALTNNEEGNSHFYAHVHDAVGELINAENFFIALVGDDDETLDFPYYVDAFNVPALSRPMRRGLSEYVIRSGKPVLADQAMLLHLEQTGEVEASPGMGGLSLCWLGVPLMGSTGVIGVVAVQSYRADLEYNKDDEELLTFVSYQIATSLQRRNHAEALVSLNLELEQRVEHRTHELREQIGVRQQIEAQLQHQVMHDPLTGLPNRLYLRDRLERALAGQRRNPERRVALLYLDVDRFKLFNDSLGHLAGDHVLREVARRLLSCVREPDVVARLSGDEFAILLEDAPMPQTAAKAAQRIQDSLEEPMLIGERQLQASASIGIAICDPRHQNIDDLLHDADVALYRAKSAGRQRFVLFDDSLQKSAMDVLDIEQELRAAIASHQFSPYFQPLVRLSDGAFIGYEALVRWQHPQRGMLGPADFLCVAEDSGLIEAIDWQMYSMACVAGADLVRDGGFITVNVSPRHFQNEDFDKRLLQVAADAGFNPAQLRIEVTEGTLLGDPEAVARILERLHAACVEAALDDFGTGYSSLSYVHRFPLKMIKIDRSFVSELGSETAQRSSAIVGAILALASSLGVEIVAEGVETPAQQQALTAMGCTFAQGYLFGRPQAAEHWLQMKAVESGTPPN